MERHGITDAALGTFDPALSDVGLFTITYAYTDANGCSNSTTGDVEVAPLPVAEFERSHGLHKRGLPIHR